MALEALAAAASRVLARSLALRLGLMPDFLVPSLRVWGWKAG